MEMLFFLLLYFFSFFPGRSPVQPLLIPRDRYLGPLHGWFLDDGTVVGDTEVVRDVLRAGVEDGPSWGFVFSTPGTSTPEDVIMWAMF
jgi:hypothetical protein